MLQAIIMGRRVEAEPSHQVKRTTRTKYTRKTTTDLGIMKSLPPSFNRKFMLFGLLTEMTLSPPWTGKTKLSSFTIGKKKNMGKFLLVIAKKRIVEADEFYTYGLCIFGVAFLSSND